MMMPETRAVDEFLDAARVGACALLLDGESGIGKTTSWLEVIARARDHGFRVLAARASATESLLAYATVADLLRGLVEQWPELPEKQKHLLERVSSQTETNCDALDWRLVAPAFLALLTRLNETSPVMIAVDDLQWIDSSSVRVLSFVALRLPSQVSVVATVLRDPDTDDAACWLNLPRPDAIRRVTIGPMSLSDLQGLISHRLDRSLSRSAMLRIREISHGNPAFALELAEAPEPGGTSDATGRPRRVLETVRSRIAGVRPQVRETLLAVACMGTPTVELVAKAVGFEESVTVELLEEAESRGILVLEGGRLRYSHPILAHGVYVAATPARRRAMHRRLAAVMEEPELRARHLALGATAPDPRTLESLDAAAELASMKGASAVAAELFDLAIKHGGDTANRRIRAAQSYFDAGEPAAARALLESAVDGLPAGTARGEALLLLSIVRLHDEGYLAAAGLLERALLDSDDSNRLRIQLLVALSHTLYNCGELERAIALADDAVAEATRARCHGLLGHAIATQATLSFIFGDGQDEVGMRRALELDDATTRAPLAFRPDVQSALVLAWTGEVDEAHRRLTATRDTCLANGTEGELIFIAHHSVMIDVWRGHFDDAAFAAELAVERAAQTGGDLPSSIAAVTRATVGAYAGREELVRSDIGVALEVGARCGSRWLVDGAITAMGFLEVSLGHYRAALDTLEPLRARFAGSPRQTEIVTAAFVPDAVEAMVALELLDDADALVTAMESNGRRLNRAWTLAVGARGRALLCAARGDLDEALAAAQRAMQHHARIAMPFEAARTQLLLGEIQRRRRLKVVSSENLREAMGVFEGLGAPLWAERARLSLARVDVTRLRTDGALSSSERQVAELVATGMTNRAIASALFISPKTVEANLARIYRKLDIPSRAALASYVGQTPA